MTKHLSLYHFLHYGKNNFLNDINDKNTLCFCAFYNSNIIITMTSCIISLMNISFVNRRCISTVIDYQHEHGARLEGKYLESLLNFERYTKMSQNFPGLSPQLLNVSICFSHVLFCIQYENYADLLTIISMTYTTNNNSCLLVNNAMLVKKFHGQIQFSCIKPRCCFYCNA